MLFRKIIVAAILVMPIVSSVAATPATEKQVPSESEEGVQTSPRMKIVISEIEDFASGTPSMAEFSHHDKDGAKTKSFVAPVIIFKESVAIFDIPNGGVLLVENINKSQDNPKIDRAHVLFVSKRGTKIVGDITEEDTLRLLQAISGKFQGYFQETPEPEQKADPTTTA